jgi:hypothetical protein
MSDERSFERFVADNVASPAGGIRMPDAFYDDIHTLASRTRQRPEWLALIKEPPMRHASRVVVGSPTARVTGLAAATLLIALLSAGALVAGAQSPAPAPTEAEPLSFFSGTQGESSEGACQLTDPPSEVVDGVEQVRGLSWGCQTVTTDDPRISGEITFIWNSDSVSRPGRTGVISAVRERIENEAGAWEGTLTELQFGSLLESAGWLVGEGAYDGLVAYVVHDSSGEVLGVIRPDDGFGAPEAFADK